MIYHIKVYGIGSYRVSKKEKETLVDFLQRVKKHYIDIKEKFPDDKVELISRTKAYPPKKNTIKKIGQLYCPYCRKYRVFHKNNDYRHCCICGISDADFHVKKYNGIFTQEMGKALRKKR